MRHFEKIFNFLNFINKKKIDKKGGKIDKKII